MPLKLTLTILSMLPVIIAALTVHLVPHTHDDVGWLKTVDEYFSGSNNTIQHAAVRNILNAVVESLKQNPDRKFTYVEQAFFQRWWRELEPAQKTATRDLVKSGQLNFVNGGWCMHDEASTHYIDMIDQTTLGHRLLKEAFGEDGVVSIGWQLDPFGHSATQAALLSGEAGFDGLFFGRIDYQDLAIRHNQSRNEFIWRASPSLGDSSQIFSGLTGEYGGNYGPPSGFNWNGNDDPIEANKDLSTYNIPSRVEAAIKQAQYQGNMTRGENIMWTMGSDFNYEQAETWFTNMDKLITAINTDGRIQMKYSSPQEYVEAKKKETKITWPVTTGDFFPYSDGAHQFWTGYFTSRPALKSMIRTTSSLFGGVRAAQCLAGSKDLSLLVNSTEKLQDLEEALGVAQHHDAVSGTAKQHVAFDYAKRLSKGIKQASSVFSDSILALRGDGAVSQYNLCLRLNETVCSMTQVGSGSVEIVLWNSLAQSRSELITIPISSSNVDLMSSGKSVDLQIYVAGETVNNYQRGTNETNYVASFIAELPPIGFTVYTLNYKTGQTKGDEEEKEANENINVNGQPFTVENQFIALNFSANGLMTTLTNKDSGVSISLDQTFCYYISSQGNKESGQKSGAYIFRPKSSSCYPIQMENGGASIELVVKGNIVQEVRQRFSSWLSQTIRLSSGARHLELEHTVGSIPFESSTVNKTLEQCVMWRQTGDCSPDGPREPQQDLPCDEAISGQASGYCECEGGRKAQLSNCGHVGFTCKQACLFTEGREVVSRFNTSIESAGILLTDSNGREMLSRKRDFRPMWNFSQTESVAGNYYPINSAVAITDAKSAQLTLLVDRASGAGSIADGELEVMIHRRILMDDGRGVGEPLNETETTRSYAEQFGGGQHSGPGLVVRGIHRLSLEEPASAAKVWRPLADRAYSRPQILFGKKNNSASISKLIDTASFVNALSPNVQVMTLQALSPTTLLVRLSHQFGIGEDSQLSKPVMVDLAKTFSPSGFQIVSIEEVSLTNSQSKSDLLKHRASNMLWNTESEPKVLHSWRSNQTINGDNVAITNQITLGSLEIKTFVVSLK